METVHYQNSADIYFLMKAIAENVSYETCIVILSNSLTFIN